MSNKELLETESEVQYELILGEGKSVQEAVFDAIHKTTDKELNAEELDLVRDYEITTFQEFVKWLVEKIVEFIDWLKEWWNSED